MTLKNQLMKLQTYKMYEDEDTVYVERDDVLKLLEQQTCEDVLDKIKAEITEKFDNCSICEWFEDYDYDENDISEYISVGHISDIIDIIDKYKTESEGEE